MTKSEAQIFAKPRGIPDKLAGLGGGNAPLPLGPESGEVEAPHRGLT